MNSGSIYRITDHIVYTVADLEQATDALEKKLGVRPIFGGYHATQGTKNALVNLDNGCYLELLAADDMNTAIQPPRWMGVDVLTKDQTTRFAIKSDNLKADTQTLQNFDSKMGSTSSGSRNTATGSLLQWELIMPLATPEVELAPFMVDWSTSEIHPNEFLPDMGCKLIEIYGTHPYPWKFDRLFNALNYNFRIEKADAISLKVVMQTPNGKVVI